uniref:Fam-e protein n=1 Tax=Parastrongyloides trichosuri TaxID=131310 RepID=A0A0N4ZQR9_PARTI
MLLTKLFFDIVICFTTYDNILSNITALQESNGFFGVSCGLFYRPNTDGFKCEIEDDNLMDNVTMAFKCTPSNGKSYQCSYDYYEIFEGCDLQPENCEIAYFKCLDRDYFKNMSIVEIDYQGEENMNTENINMAIKQETSTEVITIVTGIVQKNVELNTPTVNMSTSQMTTTEQIILTTEKGVEEYDNELGIPTTSNAIYKDYEFDYYIETPQNYSIFDNNKSVEDTEVSEGKPKNVTEIQNKKVSFNYTEVQNTSVILYNTSLIDDIIAFLASREEILNEESRTLVMIFKYTVIGCIISCIIVYLCYRLSYCCNSKSFEIEEQPKSRITRNGKYVYYYEI